MSARVDCRHYSSRSLPTGDRIERCRLDAAMSMPFACPDDCLFHEPRPLDDTGWKGPGGDRR